MAPSAALLITDANSAQLAPELPPTSGATWVRITDRAALLKIHAHPAVALIADTLTWADPLQLVAELRRRFPRCPCLLLTDGVDAPRLAEWVDAGIYDYVRRDDMVRLALAVRRAIEQEQPGEEPAQRLSGAPVVESLTVPGGPATLSRGEERYAIFVSQSSDGIWCFELAQPLNTALPPEAQIAHFYRHAYLSECNDAMARMYGYSAAAELIGTSLAEFLDEADPRNREYLLAFVEAGYRLEEAESHERDRDGHERVFLNSLVGTLEEGRLLRAWGTQRDITAQRRDEREQHLRAATGTLLGEGLSFELTVGNVARLLVPAFADYCMIHALDGAGGYRQLVGVHRDAAMQPVLDRLAVIYQPRIADVASVIGQVLRSGHAVMAQQPTSAQAAAAVGEGEILELYRRLDPRSYIIVPLPARGQVRGTMTLARIGRRPGYDERDLALASELANRCAVALDNALLYREMQKALQARDELLTIASHELRTPLTAMLGFTSVLQRRNERSPLLSERDTRALATIAEQGTRMERLISLVLDEARIEMGQLALERQPLDVGQLLAHVAAQVEPALDRHQLRLSLSRTPLLLLGDELRLEQVFLHLVLNAVKYSPRGGLITMTVEVEPGAVAVSVRDEGIGIPADELGRVGERFFRARNANPRQISGAGIGLYVMRQIVEAHGGQLVITSSEGQGTTVTVRLPLA